MLAVTVPIDCELLHRSSELDDVVRAIISKRMTRTELNRNACRGLMGETKGNTSFGRPGSKWEGNIKMYIK
jgi:hypothetical protein